MIYFDPFEESRKAEKERNLQARAASKRLLYGKHEGYWQWDLAVNWFRMSNDGFFRLYGFNFVPRGRLFDDAKGFVHSR